MIFSILFYLTIFLYSFGQLARISFYNQLVNFYLYELPLLFIFIFLLIKYRWQPVLFAWQPFKYLFIFIIYLFLIFFIGWREFHWQENLVAGLYLLRLIFYFFLFFFLFYHRRQDKSFSIIIKNSLIFFSLITVIFSAVQFCLYPQLRNLSYLGWDPHLYRMVGLFFDSSLAGAMYGILFLSFSLNHLKWQKILRLLFLICIILSFSRATYLAFFFTLLFLIKQKKFFLRIIIIFSSILLLFLIILPKSTSEGINLLRTSSVKARIEDYQLAITILRKKPIFGIGYNRIRYWKEKLGAINEVFSPNHAAASFHSSFLIISVTGGLVGLIFFILGLNNLSQINEKSKVYLLFLVLMSLFDNILLQPIILFYLTIILNLA
ncbi:MAG: O-antigen ligase family protein [Microgenomates group bacterium]|nr:O-antigen ligase family protein [Microgenomates group bacterium]